MMKTTIAALLLIIGVLVAGCPSAGTVKREDPGKAPCLTEKQSKLSIMWGDFDDYASGEWTGHELTPNTAIMSVDSTAEGSNTELLDYVGHDTYCRMVERVNAIFLKVQALHSPGTKGRFIQYINPTTGVYLRAVWNPELQTFQSRDMRALFDELSKLVPENEN